MALKRFTEAGRPDPIKDSAVVFFDDFVNEWASPLVTGTSPWISTLLASGTATTSTDAIGGVFIAANNASDDNSGSQIQLDIEAFGLQTNKDMVFGARFKTNTITENHIFMGFGITDTTFLDGGDSTAALANTAGLGLFSPDGDANFYMIATNGASTVVGNSVVPYTFAVDTYYVVEFHVMGGPTSGTATIRVFVNGAFVQQVNYSGMSTTEMGLTLAAVSGTTTAQTTTWDWVCGACER